MFYLPVISNQTTFIFTVDIVLPTAAGPCAHSVASSNSSWHISIAVKLTELWQSKYWQVLFIYSPNVPAGLLCVGTIIHPFLILNFYWRFIQRCVAQTLEVDQQVSQKNVLCNSYFWPSNRIGQLDMCPLTCSDKHDSTPCSSLKILLHHFHGNIITVGTAAKTCY